jgi:hypothetical protein
VLYICIQHAKQQCGEQPLTTCLAHGTAPHVYLAQGLLCLQRLHTARGGSHRHHADITLHSKLHTRPAACWQCQRCAGVTADSHSPHTSACCSAGASLEGHPGRHVCTVTTLQALAAATLQYWCQHTVLIMASWACPGPISWFYINCSSARPLDPGRAAVYSTCQMQLPHLMARCSAPYGTEWPSRAGQSLCKRVALLSIAVLPALRHFSAAQMTCCQHAARCHCCSGTAWPLTGHLPSSYVLERFQYRYIQYNLHPVQSLHASQHRAVTNHWSLGANCCQVDKGGPGSGSTCLRRPTLACLPYP